MTIDTICPDCGTLYTLRRELLGKRTKCTRCGGHFIITEAPAAAAPSPRPAPAPTPHHQEAFAGIPTHLPPPTPSAPPIATPSATRTERPGEFFGFETSASEPR